jgi:type I restriction enzyme M protein
MARRRVVVRRLCRAVDVLLFLKMTDEQSRPPHNKASPIPKNVDGQSLMRLDGDELETHYRHVLEQGSGPGEARRLIFDLIDKEQCSSADVKGDAYEDSLHLMPADQLGKCFEREQNALDDVT